MKALPDCNTVMVFPPGNYMEIDLKSLTPSIVQYHFIPFIKNPDYSIKSNIYSGIMRGLSEAILKRLMSDRPVAALLSGGLDSSLIAALVQMQLGIMKCPTLKTFSIGFEGSEDLRCARLVADHIKSDHYEIVMTPDEFFDAIPSVIRDIESFDITTVRASVGNWLLGGEIRKRTDCKIIFNGDGSDELFGGYKYFHRCGTDHEFETEIEHLLENINTFDVLRSDRCISSHGLEPRTPFLDKQFVAMVRSIPTEYLRPSNNCEKTILREAFDTINILPSEVLWRKKEAFSDGVSGSISWYQICKQKAEELCGTWDGSIYTHLPPKTAEAFYYRSLFEEHYPGRASVIPYFWMPKWCPETDDPSARSIHSESELKR
jgi:asparagine synthase (glutamine-hydrolysing)